MSVLELYNWFMQLKDKEKEEFCKLIYHYFPHIYNFGTMTLHEKKCFTRETQPNE